MVCAICKTRRPRRYCPGVQGDICTICCGTEREVSVNCPLDCEYLQEAHRRERSAPLAPEQIPNRDIAITDKFIRDNADLLGFVAKVLLAAALETPGAVDTDVRDALDSLTRTFRSLQSGIYYDSRPDNTLAAAIYARVQEGVQQFRQAESQQLGMAKTRDADVLGVLVFLQRVELDRNNGRPRGRAFLDFLRGYYAAETAASIVS